MRGMILAAGRGERMGELTLNTPKPLLKVGGHYLIEYAIANMVRANIKDIVINVSYLADKLKAALGNGERYGVTITYSYEPERLEVGGGIRYALPLLGQDPFVVVSGDVITDYPLEKLSLTQDKMAHLIVVDNPPFHPQGDFGLKEGLLNPDISPKFNFAGIGLYHPALFVGDCEYLSWSKVIKPAISAGKVSGEYYAGLWHNVGTPEELVQANSLSYSI